MSKGRFGTFTGVFTPTVLTILGLILFLRMGWVVGQSGLLGALIIIAIANVISAFTGLSLSSISTNMHVKAGGTYYMIARTLGLEIGGAIGIPLYMSQAISVAFYIIGFTEAFLAICPGYDPQLVATGIVLVFGILAYTGADFAMKIQFLILTVMIASMVSFFSGGWGSEVAVQFSTPSEADASFWTVFAIFFPAVTGIMVGVSMSGDLENPARSIPRGTLFAIILTWVIYIATACWLASHATTEELLKNNMIMHKVARWPVLIIAGIWASTLSSALGSILAAPRTLQAIAKDGAVPKIFGSQLGSATEPRMAVIITTAIAVCIIWMGNLNFVAPIISMFFLNTYGMINLMAGVERLVGNPSFRPQFKVHWAISLAGAFGCYGAMFLINVWATIAAICISYMIFLILHRRSIQQNWGDVRSGIWFNLAHYGLTHLNREPMNVKNWRPNIVVFAGLSKSREQMMDLGRWLSSGRGVVTLWHLLLGNVSELCERGLREVSTKKMQDYLIQNGVSAFSESTITEDLHQGVLGVMQSHGMAGLEPNTSFMAWSSHVETQITQLKIMRDLLHLKKSVMFLHYNQERGFGQKKRIDIWWRGLDRNAELMLLLAHIIKQSRDWEGCVIRVCRVMENENAAKGAEEHIASVLKKVRVDAQPKVFVESLKEKPFDVLLKSVSTETDLVILGLREPKLDDIEQQATDINALFPITATALMVRSGEVEDILETGN